MGKSKVLEEILYFRTLVWDLHCGAYMEELKPQVMVSEK